MDSPAINQIFRQLFAPARGCLRRHAQAAQNGFQQNLSHTRREYATRRRTDYMGDGQSNWQQRLDHFPRDVSKQIREYPRLTAKELARRSQRPTRVKMFTRDFIDDSLYNPNYGYFPRNATIFNLAEPFDFNSIEDGAKFQKLVDQSYIEFEDDLDAIQQDDLRQLWHTPTELFRPYYGEAIARWLVANYKASLYPYHDLVIYEIGAGNGTLMCNILDHIRETDMDVYHRTKFRIIEISQSLAEMQNTSLRHSRYFTDHLEHIQIINKSIFDWDTHVPEPSFFLALEVIDNFAHDTLRYDPYTEQPLQGSVLIDEEGRFYEYYEPNLDDLVSRFLRLRRAASRHQPPHFTKLATPIPGLNAPIAQTRYKRENVMVTTPYIHQGYFDIFFPTDFELMEDIYRAVTGKLTRVCSHADFLGSWADIESTRLKSGENVLLGGDMGGWYANVGVMITA
ncbi:hypothetical protein LTR64_007548 [Lithohypha guttulata]|uniref:uncharacterized protein n=1 Tax=Lithohypha guttulata TaxID=1690604 RepID=UPI002DE15F73|nr:hypothetical protein LTR51_007058 [Lithohypha guttulata]